MDIDSLIGSGRWKILEILAVEPSSPIELSHKLKTSVAYVSQQLKLLEAANIVFKEKTGFSQKNKPRNIYHIFREFLNITLLSKGNPKRRSINISEHQKIIINIWLLDDDKIQYIIEKIFWGIEDEINDIKGLLIDTSKPKRVFYIISNSKKVHSKINNFSKAYSFLIDLTVESLDSKKDFSNLYSIYDPLYLTKGKKMKGGDS